MRLDSRSRHRSDGMEIPELTLDFGELSRVVRRILKETDLDPALALAVLL